MAFSPSVSVSFEPQRRKEWSEHENNIHLVHRCLLCQSYLSRCIYFAQVNVTVTRSLGTLSRVWVTYQTSGDTAVSGVDFNPASGRLLFDAGQTSQQLTLHVMDDSLPEGPEMFFLNLTAVSLVNDR